jgi:hypothetical protein
MCNSRWMKVQKQVSPPRGQAPFDEEKILKSSRLCNAVLNLRPKNGSLNLQCAVGSETHRNLPVQASYRFQIQLCLRPVSDAVSKLRKQRKGPDRRFV